MRQNSSRHGFVCQPLLFPTVYYLFFVAVVVIIVIFISLVFFYYCFVSLHFSFFSFFIFSIFKYTFKAMNYYLFDRSNSFLLTLTLSLSYSLILALVENAREWWLTWMASVCICMWMLYQYILKWISSCRYLFIQKEKESNFLISTCMCN